jgi:hypothetical protein
MIVLQLINRHRGCVNVKKPDTGLYIEQLYCTKPCRIEEKRVAALLDAG